MVTDGAFTPDGEFMPVPENLGHEPFLRRWEDKVFALLLEEDRIDPSVVRQIRSWKHSAFGVDRSIRLAAGDREGIERLGQYMARGPFSLGRLVRITPSGQVIYRAEKEGPQRFPEPASPDLFGGAPRNFQVFQPLDFLAELIQHIPNKGEHLIRYYGHYSNKARGLRAKKVSSQRNDLSAGQTDDRPPPKADSRRWAMLIQKVYEADPLLCPRCGETMKIIAFIEGHQKDVIRKILEHCGLWQDPPASSPAPKPARAPPPSSPAPPGEPTREPDAEYLEYARRAEAQGHQFLWDA